MYRIEFDIYSLLFLNDFKFNLIIYGLGKNNGTLWICMGPVLFE